MPRTVKMRIEFSVPTPHPLIFPSEEIKHLNIEKALEALFNRQGNRGYRFSACRRSLPRPYFCAEQQTRWYDAVEKIPDGPTTQLMQEVAKEGMAMVIIVPIYEEDIAGVYYNTAAVIDADGNIWESIARITFRTVNPGFWEKFYFRPGNLGLPML